MGIKMQSISIKDAVLKISEHQNFLVLIHDKPDGDAIGSGLGLSTMLSRLGKNVLLCCADPLPKRLFFLTEYVDKAVKLSFSADEDFVPSFAPDFIISTDVASPSLLGGFCKKCADKIDLAIDHHLINTVECKLLYLDSKASAAGEIIYELIKSAEEIYKKKIFCDSLSSLIFAAISSDSGNFKYGNTTPKTHEIAAFLMKNGAMSERICKELFDTKSLLQMKIEVSILNTLELYFDDKLAFVSTNLKELEKLGATSADTETVVQIARQIEGVEIAVFARELESDDGLEKYKLSVRSNSVRSNSVRSNSVRSNSVRSNSVDVSELCAFFGGGGHEKAAGCTIIGKLEIVKKAFLEKAKELLQ